MNLGPVIDLISNKVVLSCESETEYRVTPNFSLLIGLWLMAFLIVTFLSVLGVLTLYLSGKSYSVSNLRFYLDFTLSSSETV